MNSTKLLQQTIGLMLVMLLLTGCDGAQTEPTSTLAPPTATLAPPTATPVPPSATPAPTATPEPTLRPTATVDSLSSQTELENEAVMTLLVLADYLYQDGDFAGAIIVYSEMLAYQMDPEVEAFVCTQRADAYDRVGEFEAAIADYLRAIELDKQGAEIFNNLCWDYAITGQAELALEYCEQSVREDPSVSSQDSRGVVYAQLGMVEEALADFEAVVDDLAGTSNPELRAIHDKRQEWIEALQSGINPITAEVLIELQEETLAVRYDSPPEQPNVVVTRSYMQEVAEESGFVFEAATEIGGEESVTGEMRDGSCRAVIVLAGPAHEIERATLQLTGCDDSTSSGHTMWFMTELLQQEAETVRAMVWLVTDVYYVIEKLEEMTVPKEIGGIQFTARNITDPETVFEVEAVISEGNE